ncbi:transglycosylase family protein [Arthrobacter sp.]|uniref:transglycosylase family protein n=1 Tax=Arthrobacter sp. TaxID=1667 RepID=UPI00339543E5
MAMVGPAANAADGATWDALAECESGGSWSTNTGNGFSGGLQFTSSTWAAHGGTGSAENASRAEQIAVAEKVLDNQGWGAWPACSAKLGLSGGGGGSQVSSQSADIQQAPVQQAPVQQAPVAEAPVQQAPAAEAPAPAAAPAVQAPAVSGETYAVQSGDTLATIAQSMGLQGGWEDLFAANTNTVSDPNLIFVDQVLQVPAQ